MEVPIRVNYLPTKGRSTEQAYQISLQHIFVILIATALAMPFVSIYLRSKSKADLIQLSVSWLAMFVSISICLFVGYRRRKRAEARAGKLVLAIQTMRRSILMPIFGLLLKLGLATLLMSGRGIPFWFSLLVAVFFGYSIASSLHWFFLAGFDRIEFREHGYLCGHFLTSWCKVKEIAKSTRRGKTQILLVLRKTKWALDIPIDMCDDADRIVQSLNDARIQCLSFPKNRARIGTTETRGTQRNGK